MPSKAEPPLRRRSGTEHTDAGHAEEVGGVKEAGINTNEKIGLGDQRQSEVERQAAGGNNAVARNAMVQPVVLEATSNAKKSG